MYHNVLQKIKSHITAIGLFFIVSIAILWQMLLPGYILTLDMVFTPTLKILFSPDAAWNTLPLQVVLCVGSLIIPGWIIQKAVLLGLFFCLGFLTYVYMPLPNNTLVRYWAGICMMVNPFVYERFLAGQWQILYALALLPVYAFCLNEFFKFPKIKRALLLGVSGAVIAIFSVHLFVMCMVFWLFTMVLASVRSGLTILLPTAVSLLTTLAGISYWFFPFFIAHTSGTVFATAQLASFPVSTIPGLSVLGTLLSGYGFWGEAEPWAHYFLWAESYTLLFWPMLMILGVIIVFGFYSAAKKYPGQALYAIIAAVIALVFAAGSTGALGSFNLWLFKTVPFWSGFRDSQKWSAVLILVYAYAGGWGVYGVITFLERYKKSVMPLGVILIILPMAYTFTIMGGFARQLQPIWYPSSWREANSYLNNNAADSTHVLFLPWHQYYSLPFNRNIITINPGRAYFDHKIIQSENPEIGGIDAEPDQLHRQIAEIVNHPDKYSDEDFAALLRKNDVKYIVATDSVGQNDDIILLKLANFKFFKPVFIGEGLTLYEILI